MKSQIAFSGGMTVPSWNSKGKDMDPADECSWLFKIELGESMLAFNLINQILIDFTFINGNASKKIFIMAIILIFASKKINLFMAINNFINFITCKIRILIIIFLITYLQFLFYYYFYYY